MRRSTALVGAALAACSVYEPSLLSNRPGAHTGGTVAASGVGQEGGEAGEGVLRGGFANGGRVSSGGTSGGGDAGSDNVGGAVDTGGTEPASGGAAKGGTSSGGTPSGGASSGGVASGGAAKGGTSSGGTSSGGASSGGASSGGASSGGASSGGTAGGGTSGAGSGGAAGAGKGGTGGTLTTGGQSTGGSAGAGGPGVLFSDNFETGNASAWAPTTSGDFSVISDGSLVYRQGTVVNALRVASAGSAAWTDQAVQARVKVLAFGGTTVSSSYFAAIFARYTDENNHYYLALRSDGKVSIRRKIAGSNASIGSAITLSQPITAGTWYTLKLEVVGTTLNAYVDGTLYGTVSDTSFASGKAGVGSTNASAVFDDVVVSLP